MCRVGTESLLPRPAANHLLRGPPCPHLARVKPTTSTTSYQASTLSVHDNRVRRAHTHPSTHLKNLPRVITRFIQEQLIDYKARPATFGKHGSVIDESEDISAGAVQAAEPTVPIRNRKKIIEEEAVVAVADFQEDENLTDEEMRI